MKGRPQRKECGSCCGLGVEGRAEGGVGGGHRQGEEVGVGFLSFDIGWPTGVHDSVCSGRMGERGGGKKMGVKRQELWGSRG